LEAHLIYIETALIKEFLEVLHAVEEGEFNS
jgi:hypothetical protein